MSKQSSSRLTPLRKNRRHRLRQSRRLAEFRRLDALDEISTRCQRAITLAGLLEACGRSRSRTAGGDGGDGAGGLIRVEIRAMEALLKTFWREAAQ